MKHLVPSAGLRARRPMKHLVQVLGFVLVMCIYWGVVPRSAALAAPAAHIQQDTRMHSDVPASSGPRRPSVLLGVPGMGGCQEFGNEVIVAEGVLAATPPRSAPVRIAATLLAVVTCAIPFGLPASCFLVAGLFRPSKSAFWVGKT